MSEESHLPIAIRVDETSPQSSEDSSQDYPWLKVLEAVIFSGLEPSSTLDLLKWIQKRAAQLDRAEQFQDLTPRLIDEGIESLNQSFAREKRPYELIETAKGWKLYFRDEWSAWVRPPAPVEKPSKLSPSAMETLAVIAYRQPVTKAEIERIRGVSADGMVNLLLEKQLICPVGRAESAGKPWLYGTTELFLEMFGIVKLEDLPNALQLTQRLETLNRES